VILSLYLTFRAMRRVTVSTLWCPKFKQNKTSIDIVAHEEVVGLGHLATDFKELHEVVELTVDVSANDDGGSNGDNIGLLS
jgi:formyltetrahydrofolate synthetase